MQTSFELVSSGWAKKIPEAEALGEAEGLILADGLLDVDGLLEADGLLDVDGLMETFEASISATRAEYALAEALPQAMDDPVSPELMNIVSNPVVGVAYPSS